jgi:selenophosphate synthetase-related protein
LQNDSELDLIARQFRENPSVRAKSSIRLVTEVLGPSDWLAGPGDDAAVVATGDVCLLVAGEAIFPPFVATDPHGAGIAAVLTNMNDVAAMGGRPLAIVDTIVGPEPVARQALEGMREAAALYGVPIVGGHLSVRPGPPSLSAFALGRAERPLSARHAAPGQALLLAVCLEGTMRDDFPFFSAVGRRGPRMRDDLELLPVAAEAGLCVAAKDVSMAGLLGSLAMLLEPNKVGCTVELELVPRPDGVSLPRWLPAFPSYGFLLCSAPERAVDCRRLFQDAGLACEIVGTIDESGKLRARLGGRETLIVDMATEAVTGLLGPDA